MRNPQSFADATPTVLAGYAGMSWDTRADPRGAKEAGHLPQPLGLGADRCAEKTDGKDDGKDNYSHRHVDSFSARSLQQHRMPSGPYRFHLCGERAASAAAEGRRCSALDFLDTELIVIAPR